ncbi:HGGxSTG domain-containing protein [Roseovarius sp. MBR-6]|uniref:HGGxSTG domain-containing protein n=1 Tax=Roseovarius sp. MBR-6 TaxID=3156459 RepID=UPI0033917507
MAPPKRCGAETRKGTPCRAKPLPGKRRCKFHGGMSTGPRTPEGRERIAEAQRQRWQAWRVTRGAV